MSATATRLGLCLALVLSAGCQKAAPAPAPSASSVPAFSAPTVYFASLRAFLPQAPAGFSPVKDRGSTGKYGEVSVSEAERVFRGGGHEITVRIVDTTLVTRLGKSIKAAVQDASSRDASDPTAPILLRDALGFVRYDPDEEHAEANLLVGDRYVVAVTTRGFDDTREVRRIAHSLDLEGLAKLR